MDFLIIRPDNSNPNKTGKALDILVLRSLRYKSISMYFNLVNASWFLFVECNRHKSLPTYTKVLCEKDLKTSPSALEGSCFKCAPGTLCLWDKNRELWRRKNSRVRSWGGSLCVTFHPARCALRGPTAKWSFIRACAALFLPNSDFCGVKTYRWLFAYWRQPNWLNACNN